MTAWTEIVAFNALGASLLALVAWLAGRRLRRPVLTHALWTLVFIKLLSVPLVEFEVVSWRPGKPGTTTPEATETMPAEATPAAATSLARTELAAGEVAADEVTARGSRHERSAHAGDSTSGGARRWGRHAASGLAGIAAAGTLALLFLSALRAWRFRRRLDRRAREVPELTRRARDLCALLGLRRVPAVRVVDANLSPALVPTPSGGCAILLPGALVSRLESAELDTLLAHELVHARRRDHWVRVLELVTTAVYWWHPVVWWARRHLRSAEEQCCDLAVKTAFPRQARAYARALLKTVEFLSERRDSIPALATGAGNSSRLAERMTMILKHKTPRPIPKRLRALLFVVALVVIFVSPAWLDEGVGAAASPSDERATETDEIREAAELQMLELERQRLKLEREFAELELERTQLRRRLEAAEAQVEVERLTEELRRLEAASDGEAADLVRQRLEILKREMQLRREKLDFEQKHTRMRIDLDLELRHLELELRQAYVGAGEDEIRELEKRVLQLRQRQQEMELEGMRGELQHQRRKLELERAQLQRSRTR